MRPDVPGVAERESGAFGNTGPGADRLLPSARHPFPEVAQGDLHLFPQTQGRRVHRLLDRPPAAARLPDPTVHACHSSHVTRLLLRAPTRLRRGHAGFSGSVGVVAPRRDTEVVGTEEAKEMTSVRIPMMWRSDSGVLVPADVLSTMLRQVAEELTEWPEQGADRTTVQAVQVLLSQVADQIDVDCIALTSEMDPDA
jgi:hypothetical protein